MDEPTFAISVRAVRRVAIVLTAVAVIGGLVYLAAERLPTNGGLFTGRMAVQIDPARYQAVFLSGGQVFFGRLVSNGEVLLLTEVFYLTSAPSAESAEPGTLVKRGNELFGPTEPMVIPNEQVLFLENLRDDSQVVQAIRRFRSGEAPPAATPRPLSPTLRPSSSPAR